MLVRHGLLLDRPAFLRVNEQWQPVVIFDRQVTLADDPIDPRLHLLYRQVLVEPVSGAQVEGSGEHFLGSRPLEDQGQQVPPAAHDEVVGAAKDHPNLRRRQGADSFRVQVIGNALDPAAHLLVSPCSFFTRLIRDSKALQEPLSSCCESWCVLADITHLRARRPRYFSYSTDEKPLHEEASTPSVLQGNGFRGLHFDFSTSARKAAFDSRSSLTSESSSSGSSA